MVLFMPEALYGFSVTDKFLLTTTPALLGALVRLPYTFAVAKFGGRNWTVVSAALLLVPSVLAILLLEPGRSRGGAPIYYVWIGALVGSLVRPVGGCSPTATAAPSSRSGRSSG